MDFTEKLIMTNKEYLIVSILSFEVELLVEVSFIVEEGLDSRLQLEHKETDRE